MTARDGHLAKLAEIVACDPNRTANEAETRHKIIDCVLHDVLSWPRNRVAVEEYITPGFADYVLKKKDGDGQLLIEAKKAGIYFSLPFAHKADETYCYMAISTLKSDPNINNAMLQVRTYCVDTGCEYAAITNGHEWILFKTFERGKRWDRQSAFVIRTLNFFFSDYTKAVNSLSFVAITEHSALPNLLNSSTPK